MTLRFILSLILALVIVCFAGMLSFFQVLVGPSGTLFGLILLTFFAILGITRTIFGLRKGLHAPPDSTEPVHRDWKPFAFWLVPVITCVTAVAIHGNYVTSTWNLPSRALQNTSAIPEESEVISFQVDGVRYLASIDDGQLLEWVTESTSTEEVTSTEYFLDNRTLVNRDGSSFVVEIQQPPTASDLALHKKQSLLTWRYLYPEQDAHRGVWLQPVDAHIPPTQLFATGWQPVRTENGVWYKCDVPGLIRIEDETETLIYETTDGEFVRTPVLSPDEQFIAFRIDASRHKNQGRDRIVVVDLSTSESLVAYTTQGGGTAESPMWSHAGNQLAFRITETEGFKQLVPTLAVYDMALQATEKLAEFESGMFLTPAGVSSFCWSPDDSRLAFLGSLKGATALANEGGTLHHKWDLYLIQPDGKNLRRLTALQQAPRQYAGGVVSWWPSK